MKQDIEQEDYELLTPINFFGQFIASGTRYVRVNADNWHPIINEARCPHYQITFMIVRNNPTYFKLINNG